MNKNLVYDIGMYRGEDTAWYLFAGYNVVAVEADPALVRQCAKKFAKAVKDGRLQIVNAAVTGKPVKSAPFYIGEKKEWSSLNKNFPAKKGYAVKEKEVPAVTLPELFEKFGLPYYCKIDIEGADREALNSITGSKKLPPYISCETECAPPEVIPPEEEALAALVTLRNLGYTKFKLVDQYYLKVLEPGKKFYDDRYFLKKGGKRLDSYNTRKIISEKLRYKFGFGCSGPFANDLAGRWLDYENARKNLLTHRHDYFMLRNAVPDGFWCDLHAAFR